ncbi:hypothetical protein CapIbe_007438 [Capra ibex]
MPAFDTHFRENIREERTIRKKTPMADENLPIRRQDGSRFHRREYYENTRELERISMKHISPAKKYPITCTDL